MYLPPLDPASENRILQRMVRQYSALVFEAMSFSDCSAPGVIQVSDAAHQRAASDAHVMRTVDELKPLRSFLLGEVSSCIDPAMSRAFAGRNLIQWLSLYVERIEKPSGSGMEAAVAGFVESMKLVVRDAQECGSLVRADLANLILLTDTQLPQFNQVAERDRRVLWVRRHLDIIKAVRTRDTDSTNPCHQAAGSSAQEKLSLAERQQQLAVMLQSRYVPAAFGALKRDPTLKPLLASGDLKRSLYDRSRRLKREIDLRRPKLLERLCSDEISGDELSPLDVYILGAEVGVFRYQRTAANLYEVFRVAEESKVVERSNPLHHSLRSKLVSLDYRPPSVRAIDIHSPVREVLNYHRLMLNVGNALLFDNRVERWYLSMRDVKSSRYMAGYPKWLESSITPLEGMICLEAKFFAECLSNRFEGRELPALLNKLKDPDTQTLARYVERLVDALDGGFNDDLEFTRSKRDRAQTLAKKLKLNVLIAELRSQYDLSRNAASADRGIDVTFMPTRGWLMEVAGAISGSCIGQLKNIAQTHTEGFFVPFVVNGTPSHISGGAFVFEGRLESGEKVMVIRGFNPRAYLLNHVDAGELFEKFADYVKELAGACGTHKMVLPRANFWHNPATIRPAVHFYMQDTFMRRAPLRLGACQVRTFNNFNVEYVVQVR